MSLRYSMQREIRSWLGAPPKTFVYGMASISASQLVFSFRVSTNQPLYNLAAVGRILTLLWVSIEVHLDWRVDNNGRFSEGAVKQNCLSIWLPDSDARSRHSFTGMSGYPANNTCYWQGLSKQSPTGLSRPFDLSITYPQSIDNLEGIWKMRSWGIQTSCSVN